MDNNVLTFSVGKHHVFTIMQQEKRGLVEFALWQGDEMVCPSDWVAGGESCQDDVIIGTINQAVFHLNNARKWAAE